MSKVSRPVSPSDFSVSPGQKFQRQHAHADQIAAMDALEAFGEHGADAEQDRALRGPIARGAGAIFFARNDR